jgi:hypothetical protein
MRSKYWSSVRVPCSSARRALSAKNQPEVGDLHQIALRRVPHSPWRYRSLDPPVSVVKVVMGNSSDSSTRTMLAHRGAGAATQAQRSEHDVCTSRCAAPRLRGSAPRSPTRTACRSSVGAGAVITIDTDVEPLCLGQSGVSRRSRATQARTDRSAQCSTPWLDSLAARTRRQGCHLPDPGQ